MGRMFQIWESQRLLPAPWFRLRCSHNPSQQDLDSVLDIIQPKLPRTMAHFLDSQFTRDDVHKAVFEIRLMKTPSKDGLPTLFYQKFGAYLDLVWWIHASSVFIRGRQISNNTIVGFECLHRLKHRKRKIGLVAIKLDMSKAYNRVEWIFLEQMMLRLSFPEKWVKMLMRGTLQPDYRGNSMGKLASFKCSRSGPTISHLFFTYDSLIFAKANDANCVEGRRVLNNYDLASKQLVNFDKSPLCVSPSLSAEEGNKLVSIVGMKLVDCHDKYLGLLCYIGRSKKKLFTQIVDCVWQKIKGWASNFCLHELMTPFGAWNLNVIKQNFCKDDMTTTLSIPTSSTNNIDFLIWHYDDIGVFTVKSDYWLARNMEQQPSTSTDLYSPCAAWWKTL
ncbi:hypothetical protein Dsin_000762 [Dipteronia sinensis]|uniref:Reverse transcriptase n=1 Tax=Dipteronia sinensis TaxID=43782 RepID=A0AAE0B2I9_9ROSI|nr:hypothetical protein Dsin_000762 [Dipteronia sinensis]